MSETYTTCTGSETMVVESQKNWTTRIIVRGESGEQAINLDADKMRKLMAVLGTFVEPFPGAWSKPEVPEE